jgi:ribosomal protein S18 acetylase RimI-like enzyme
MTAAVRDGQPVDVEPADPRRRSALASMMAEAFHDDPVSMWLFPEADSRRAIQTRFFSAFLEVAFVAGEVFTTSDEAGVALWLPVDPANADDSQSLMDELVRHALGENGRRFGILDQLMSAVHPEHERHHYLMFLAVPPQRQNTGIGSTLLAARLTDLDAAGVPTYLEASSPRNAALYERLGYRQHGSPIPLPEGPQLLPMWRTP